MKVFRITQAATGIVLWTGAALDASAALDTMALAAGYPDRTRLPDHLRAGGLHVADMEAGGAMPWPARASRRHVMTKLFIAQMRRPGGPEPLVTVRAEAEGEARLFLTAAYPEAEIAGLTEPSDWTSDADTGSRVGDIREHPGVTWQPPSSLAD